MGDLPELPVRPCDTSSGVEPPLGELLAVRYHQPSKLPLRACRARRTIQPRLHGEQKSYNNNSPVQIVINPTMQLQLATPRPPCAQPVELTGKLEAKAAAARQPSQGQRFVCRPENSFLSSLPGARLPKDESG